MDTVFFQRELYKMLSNKIHMAKEEHIQKEGIIKYLDTISRESLYKKPVSQCYNEYNSFCAKNNIDAVKDTIFYKTMGRFGFKAKPIKNKGKVYRGYYY